MMEERKITAPSTDRIHTLSGVAFIPDGEICGILQIIHGMTEYIMRYEGFMREMAEHGFLCFGYDQLGHGSTAKDDSELGFIAHEDGWKYLVEDTAVFPRIIKKEYGEELPYILLGHSMGSFTARLSAEKFNMHDKLIIMGTGGPNPAVDVGIKLCREKKHIKGEFHKSKLINNLAFGAYNKKFGYDDKHNWLSNIESVRAAYASDRLCNFDFTVSAMEDLFRLTKYSNREKWFSSCVTEKPILILSGEDDPVGDYGMGPEIIHRLLESSGANVRLILYKGCRHELLNDICREKVISDILEFIS